MPEPDDDISLQAATRPRRRTGSGLRRGALLVAALFMIGLVALLGYASVLHVTGNFHTVVAHEAYRASQPSASDLERYVQRVGIRTVINLRGANEGSPWYDEEVAASERLGLTHVDFRMSSRRRLSQEDAAQLIALMREAEKPVLIHCAGGSDRSGLAAALYVAALAHGGHDASEGQLSLAYGHIPLPRNPAFAMDLTFEALEPWLGIEKHDAKHHAIAASLADLAAPGPVRLDTSAARDSGTRQTRAGML